VFQAPSCNRDLSQVIANPFIGSLIGFLFFCAGSSSAVAIYAKISHPHYYPMWVGFSLQRSNRHDAGIGFFCGTFLSNAKLQTTKIHLLSLGSSCRDDSTPKVVRHALSRDPYELSTRPSMRSGQPHHLMVGGPSSKQCTLLFKDEDCVFLGRTIRSFLHITSRCLIGRSS
jgi:hypothetical protein